MKISKVIASALRKLGVSTYDSQPTPDQMADALNALHSIYENLISGGCFGRFVEVRPFGDNYTGAGNQRVIRSIDNPDFTFSLPESASDNAPLMLSDEITGTYDEWIFDAQARVWFSISDLRFNYVDNDAASAERLSYLADQQAPLSYRDANGLASRLAIEISADYNAAILPQVQMASRNFSYNLTHNYSQPDLCDPQPGIVIEKVPGQSDDPFAFAVGPDDDILDAE